MSQLSFSEALEAIRRGKRASRNGWNGKHQFIFLVDLWTYTGRDNYLNLPFIAIKTEQETVAPWLASQSDLIADDWRITD